MAWWVWTLIGVYVVGFVGVLWINLMSGPATIPLCLFRALVWPIWIATGWPRGVPLQMD